MRKLLILWKLSRTNSPQFPLCCHGDGLSSPAGSKWIKQRWSPQVETSTGVAAPASVGDVRAAVIMIEFSYMIANSDERWRGGGERSCTVTGAQLNGAQTFRSSKLYFPLYISTETWLVSVTDFSALYSTLTWIHSTASTHMESFSLHCKYL